MWFDQSFLNLDNFFYRYFKKLSENFLKFLRFDRIKKLEFCNGKLIFFEFSCLFKFFLIYNYQKFYFDQQEKTKIFVYMFLQYAKRKSQI